MSLLTNIQHTAFETKYPTDKIVRVFQGTINIATQMVPIAGLGSPNYLRFAHGFNRPVFTSLVSSPDNVTYYDGGLYNLAFSDATYVYILSVQTLGTIYYKLLCTWIDDYDTTNPLVSPVLNFQKNTLFDSRSNYQKIYMQGVSSMPSNSTMILTHNLGHSPNGRVFFEAFGGQVWPANSGGTGNPWLYDLVNQAELYFVSKTNTFEMTIAGGATTRQAWYRIYTDGT